MTNCFCERPLHLFAEIMVVAALVASQSACAVSRKYDGEARVTLRDGQPCFYVSDRALKERINPQWWDISVSVSRHRSEFNAVWVAGIKAAVPISPSSCVVYGFDATSAKVLREAQPLPSSISPYEVFLGIGRLGQEPGGKYGLRFCFGADAAGTPVLRRWDSELLECSAEILYGDQSQPQK